MTHVEKVNYELKMYEHPFFTFSASEHPKGVEIYIRSVISNVLEPEFRLTLSPREIEHPQFRWSFQGLLYGCLNYYVVELFTKTPMTSE